MLEWLKPRKRSAAVLALCPAAGGIASASVSRDGHAQPVLEWAQYLAVAQKAGNRASALAGLTRTRKVHGATATSLMPLGSYHLLLLEAPPVPANELRAAVRWRVKDLIDFDIDDAVIDVVEVPPLKGGRDNMVYAVVARKQAVRAVIDEIEACDVELLTVDIPEFAIRNLAALVAEDIGGMALIYLDEESGLITITRQQTLYMSRRFECGRRRLFADAPREVTPALEGILDSIVIEVQRSLDYYESQFAQPAVQGVVIAPLGAELRGVAEYLGAQLGVPARMLTMAELLDIRTPLEAGDEARCVTAVGAALRSPEALA